MRYCTGKRREEEELKVASLAREIKGVRETVCKSVQVGTLKLDGICACSTVAPTSRQVRVETSSYTMDLLTPLAGNSGHIHFKAETLFSESST